MKSDSGMEERGGNSQRVVSPPTPNYDDGVEYAEKSCPKCGNDTFRRQCNCDDGLSHHDCGEDCCCCLDPEPNVTCDDCEGHGWCNWCPVCGWDLLCKRYINGCPETPTSVKTLATSHELEIQQVRNAITRMAAEIVRVEGVLARMREKQTARIRELAIQEKRSMRPRSQSRERL